MPDEDRFERMLRGRGWRKVYRLAAGNSPIPMTVDAAISAAAHALRNDLRCPRMREIADILRSASQSMGPSVTESFIVPAAIYDASAKLDEVGEKEFGCLATRLALRAAKKTLVELVKSEGRVSAHDSETKFAEQFVAGLIEHQCLGRVRSGVIEKTGRSLDEQAEWEGRFEQQLKPQATRLLKSAFESQDPGRIRAPKRLVGRVPTTIEQLHRPIASA